MKQLTHCTLTGVDEKTDLSIVTNLSIRFPVVEWGFLYSPKRQGEPGRYPSVNFLQSALQNLPAHVRVALHVCGAGVQNLLDGEPVISELLRVIAERNGRVQINFSARRRNDSFTLAQIREVIAQNAAIQFITQINQANEGVSEQLKDLPNYAALFDSSGGRGVSAGEWSSPLEGVKCGYAGGLGPDNIASELAKIHSLVAGQSFWIDMEGKLRGADDTFDLIAAMSVLDAVDEFEDVLYF